MTNLSALMNHVRNLRLRHALIPHVGLFADTADVINTERLVNKSFRHYSHSIVAGGFEETS